MSNSEFTYTIYIMESPEKVWRALTDSKFTKQYWGNTSLRTDWKIGSTVDFLDQNGRVTTTGKVLEFNPPRRLSYTWQVTFHEVFSSEGFSRATFELVPMMEATCLTLTHDEFPEGSIVRDAIAGGWPSVLSGLKTLLETGKVLVTDDPNADKDPYEAAVEWALAEREKRKPK